MRNRLAVVGQALETTLQHSRRNASRTPRARYGSLFGYSGITEATGKSWPDMACCWTRLTGFFEKSLASADCAPDFEYLGTLLNIIPDIHSDSERLNTILGLIANDASILFLGEFIDDGYGVKAPVDWIVLRRARHRSAATHPQLLNQLLPSGLKAVLWLLELQQPSPKLNCLPAESSQILYQRQCCYETGSCRCNSRNITNG